MIWDAENQKRISFSSFSLWCCFRSRQHPENKSYCNTKDRTSYADRTFSESIFFDLTSFFASLSFFFSFFDSFADESPLAAAFSESESFLPCFCWLAALSSMLCLMLWKKRLKKMYLII